MLSTMQDAPLTIATIMRHATGQNSCRTVTTALGGGQYRTMTYGEVGRQSGRLANALRAEQPRVWVAKQADPWAPLAQLPPR